MTSPLHMTRLLERLDLTRRRAVRGVRRRYNAWSQNAEGVAAIEFALLAPMISLLFVGAVEMSQALTVDRRAQLIASATADLVARANATITSTEMTDIMRVGGYMMLPYSSTPLQTTVRNITSSTTSATTTKQSWYCSYNLSGTGATTCACNVTAYTLPTGLVNTNDSVVVTEVKYNYTPLIFDTIMKRTFTKTGAYYVLSKIAYAKPRSQAAMLQQSNGTSCPAPTFP
jgi:Flp pilus assembly protein TadG